MIIKAVRRAIGAYRFERAFQSQEREARSQHLERARVEFDTGPLILERAALERRVEEQIRQRLGEALSTATRDRVLAESQVAVQRGAISLLRRNFRRELAPHYAELAAIQQSLRTQYDAKDEAYEQLEEAKADIDSWHRWSTCYLGKRNKSIPKRAFFGIDQRDLERAQDNRDSAREDIADCKQAIESLKADRQRVRIRIVELKSDRTRASELRKQPPDLAQRIKELAVSETAATAARLREDGIRSDSVDFAIAASRAAGIDALSAEIVRIDTARAAFVADFDRRFASLRRRALFRQLHADAN